MFLTDSKVGLGTPWRRIGNLPETRREMVFRCFATAAKAIGTIVFLTDSKIGLGTPWRRMRDLPETRREMVFRCFATAAKA